ncbi:MAG: hypothetical protein ABL889_00750 [Terricaulis sp.]
MRVTASSGVVDKATTFDFNQAGDVVSARYCGGSIVDGFLLGRLASDVSLRFRYIQLDVGGNLDCGVSNASISRSPDGRLVLVEDYQFLTRPDAGRNTLEEI